MVLGLRSKTRKDTSVQVDYIVIVQQIKPWPPSQSLKSVQYVLLQWENGEQNSGFIPANVKDNAIEFNEPFMLPLTLSREKRTRESFQKNCLEFYLYESRKDKPSKGQLLGTAIINLADYGIVRNNIDIGALMNCKKVLKNSVQPVLFISVQPFDKDSSSRSPDNSLSKEASLDKDGGDFAKESLNVENDNESDISFLSEDDVSSHNSHTISSSAFETDSSMSQHKEVANSKGKTQEQSQESAGDKSEDTLVPKVQSSDAYVGNGANFDLVATEDSRANGNDNKQVMRQRENGQVNATAVHQLKNELPEYEKGEVKEKKHATLRSETLMSNRRAATNSKLKHMMSVQLPSGSDGYSEEIHNVVKSREITNRAQARNNAKLNETTEETKLSSESSERKPSSVSFEKKPSGVSFEKKPSSVSSEKKLNSESYESKPNNGPSQNKPSIVSSESKPEERSRIGMLEEELREAAIVEAAFYSVVAEHGSSTNKLHAPARRLARFYLHSYRAKSSAISANAARAAVSGLILVSKSCGNDVPRLTFWLSNSVILRAIINQVVQKTPVSQKSNVITKGSGNLLGERTARDKLSLSKKGNTSKAQESSDWENPDTFLIALEKVEAWIFYRIVESVWWQTMTPHMQSAAAKASVKGSSSRKNKYGLSDQEQGSFSIELWKKAFNDACERLCPIRAGGHECGCLPVLARLVMEQLVDRLDVAMCNAILRESGDEMPTDPMSDPISDSKVLPIPSGKSSFGAGAQLKNAIGTWSRWLSDLFGIEDNDSLDDENDGDDGNVRMEDRKSFKAFRLLNALSDLMMLPIEMLADSATRKEVCPLFGVEVIKGVLYNFVPDEFSPQPIPSAVLEALDTEVEDENSGESITFPFNATPTTYVPPPAASLAGFIGEVGNQALQRCTSSVLRKSYTSDDELDELDSPLTSIIIDKNRSSPSSATKSIWLPKGGRNVVRYQLLREVWKDGQ